MNNGRTGMRRVVIALSTALVSLVGISLPQAQTPDYGGYRPHYQGYGVNTPGGRRGAICRVTSLSDKAWPPVAGTLRHCAEISTGPRS